MHWLKKSCCCRHAFSFLLVLTTRSLILLSVSTTTFLPTVSAKNLDPNVIALKTTQLFSDEELSLPPPQQRQQYKNVNATDSVPVPSALPMVSLAVPLNNSDETMSDDDQVTMDDQETIQNNNNSSNSNKSAEAKDTAQETVSIINSVIAPTPNVTSADLRIDDKEALLASHHVSKEVKDCKCGVLPVSDKAQSSQRNEHPWAGAMFHRTVNNDSSPALLMYCGAVLISDRYALTTSRCVNGIKTSEIEVWFSEDKIWSDTKPSAGVHKSNLESVQVHPEFTRKVLDHEIAILKLSSPVEFLSSRNNKISSNAMSIVPVCLPLPTWNSGGGDYYSPGVNATLTSWDKKGRTSYTLLKSNAAIISNEDCKLVVNKSPTLRRRSDNTTMIFPYRNDDGSAININENVICAGDVENGAPDSCESDTGSPLVVDGINERKTVVGLVSWLYGCTSQTELTILYNIIFDDDTAKPQVPGVYTHVQRYYQWIMENTKDSQWCTV